MGQVKQDNEKIDPWNMTAKKHHLTWVKWPLSESVQTINAGEGVEKGEPSYTDAVDVDC